MAFHDNSPIGININDQHHADMLSILMANIRSYPIEVIGMNLDIGMGMVLTSALCVPFSTFPSIMVDIALSFGLNLEFYLVTIQAFDDANDNFEDVHSTTLVVNEDKEETVGPLYLEQILCPLEGSIRIDSNSNDMMVKKLKQLDVDHSNFEGPYLNSSDLKRRKRKDDQKPNFKKKKHQKASSSYPVPL
ncbi:hypothetical protein Ancab_014758 [Ancistrocladus abbreviatus]